MSQNIFSESRPNFTAHLSFHLFSSAGQGAVVNYINSLNAVGSNNPQRLQKDGGILTLSQYTARCNIQLIRTADLNEKLVQRGVDSDITVQRICRDCRNEDEVKEVLDAIWESPKSTASILNKILMKNRNLFELEQKLATTVSGKIECQLSLRRRLPAQKSHKLT